MRNAPASLLALCCVAAVTALPPRAEEPSPPTHPDPHPTAAAHPLPRRSIANDCKPSAPLRIALEAPDAASDRLAISYTVTPLVDVLDLEVELRLPHGGEVASHAAVRAGGLESGATRSGSARIQAPLGAGFALEVIARARVADPVIEGGIATLRTIERIEYGAPPIEALGAELTTPGDGSLPALRSRDLPALHRPSGTTGTARRAPR